LSAWAKAPLDRPKMFWATSEVTFVLILVIANPLWDRN
jgi:hypothetical protein